MRYRLPPLGSNRFFVSCYNLRMLPNLHSTYAAGEARSKLLIAGVTTTILAALAGVVFLSPSYVIGVVIGVIALFVAFARPTIMLAFLALYLPFEPFLLKWVPDDIYLFVRYGSELLVYLLVAVVVFKLLTGEIRLRRSPIDVPFALFIVALVASVAVNLVPPFIAILGARQILRFVLLFFVVVYLQPSKNWIRTLIFALGAIMAIEIVIGAAQAIIGGPLDAFLLPSEARTFGDLQLTTGTVQFWDPGQRVFATMGRYDQLGTFLGFFLLIAVAAVYEKVVAQEQRIYLWMLILSGLGVLALTYSRSAWFGFVVGFLFIAIAMKRDKWVTLAAVVVPVVLTLYVATTGLVVDRLVDVPRQNIVDRFFEAFSYERWQGEYYGLGRLFWIVQTVAYVVPASPIFGHGPGMYGGGAVAALGNTTVYDELGLPFGVFGTGGYIDNNWFSLWGETGTVGLFAYLWMIGALLFVCIYVAKNSKDPETRTLALGVAAAILSVVLNAFLASFLEIRTLAPYLWIMTAAVVVQGQREKLL